MELEVPQKYLFFFLIIKIKRIQGTIFVFELKVIFYE